MFQILGKKDITDQSKHEQNKKKWNREGRGKGTMTARSTEIKETMRKKKLPTRFLEQIS
jgi:hypothetical protein